MSTGSWLALAILGGGVAGVFFNFWANSWLAWWRRSQLHRKLRFELPVIAEDNTLSVRVVNGYKRPLTSCWAYVTIDHQLSDVLAPPLGKHARITDKHPAQVVEARLCWSRNPDLPQFVDILPGEWQSLQVLEFDPAHGKWIGIFAETRGNPYRVFLLGGAKVYEGTLKIVCNEMEAVTTPIHIELGNLARGDLVEKFLKPRQPETLVAAGVPAPAVVAQQL